MSEAAKCKKELTQMMKDPANKHCADCNAYPATWASTNIGVFLCLRCSGIHRGLGVHISFVKSATLDDWNLKLLQKFKEKNGNLSVNRHYEATLPDTEKLHENSQQIQVVKFIHLKYVKKIWYKAHVKKIKKIHSHHNHHKNHKNKNKNQSRKPQSSQLKSIKEPEPKPKSKSTKPLFKKRESFLTENDLDLFASRFHNNDQEKEKEKESQKFDVLEIIQNSNVDESVSNVNDNDNINNNQWVGFNTDDNVEKTGDEGKSSILAKYHQNEIINNSNNNQMIQMQQMAQMQKMQQMQQMQQQQQQQMNGINMNNVQYNYYGNMANNNNEWVGFNTKSSGNNGNNANSKDSIMSKYNQQQNYTPMMNAANYYNMNMNANMNMMPNHMNNNMTVAAHW